MRYYMKIFLLLSTFLTLSVLTSGQDIFSQGNYDACKPDRVFTNSPFFGDKVEYPKYNNKVTIQDYFRNKIGTFNTKDKRIVFKFILNCLGEITNVWMFKTTGDDTLDQKFVDEIKNLDFWTPATYDKKEVDFEVTLIGAIKNNQLYFGSEMYPPKEFFEEY